MLNWNKQHLDAYSLWLKWPVTVMSSQDNPFSTCTISLYAVWGYSYTVCRTSSLAYKTGVFNFCYNWKNQGWLHCTLRRWWLVVARWSGLNNYYIITNCQHVCLSLTHFKSTHYNNHKSHLHICPKLADPSILPTWCGQSPWFDFHILHVKSIELLHKTINTEKSDGSFFYVACKKGMYESDQMTTVTIQAFNIPNDIKIKQLYCVYVCF